MTPSTPAFDRWSPTYFLSSVGAGGISISFFLWLYMWIPHPGQNVPIFEDIAAAWATGNILQQVVIVLAMAGVAFFGILNLRHLFWNLSRWAAFRVSPAYDTLCNSNAKASILALPLAIAMGINVSLVIGMVFVPKLWTVVEYLFPLAMTAFSLTAILALSQMGKLYGRIFGHGGFDWTANNSFAQVLPAFALGMIAVGIAASAALSSNPVTVGVAIVLATVLFVIALLVTVAAVIVGLVSMAQHGTAIEGAPTLTMILPVTTVLGILLLRVNHGLGVHFDAHMGKGDYLSLLSMLMGIEIAFLMLGLAVLRAQGYIGKFITGPQVSPASYGLVCPGVAFAVMTQFFINKGLVGAGVIAKFGAAYWSLSAVVIVAQLIAVYVLWQLNAKHFRRSAAVAVPAQ